MTNAKLGLEVKMPMTKQIDRRRADRRQGTRRKGEIKIIKISGKGDKGQEVMVRHEAVLKKKGSSVWSEHEEFTRKWSETFTTKKKRKKTEKKGE